MFPFDGVTLVNEHPPETRADVTTPAIRTLAITSPMPKPRDRHQNPYVAYWSVAGPKKVIATELMQYRFPVGSGPSSNT